MFGQLEKAAAAVIAVTNSSLLNSFNDQRRPKMATGPTNEEIQVRAYELYLQCGCDGGHDLEHWLEAEKELTGVGSAQDSREEIETQVFKPAPESSSTEEVPVTASTRGASSGKTSSSATEQQKTAVAGRDRR
jgi:hypothetical protein